MEREAKDDEIAGIVKQQFSQLEEALYHVILFGQQSGEITSKQPAITLARSFRSSYYGLRVLTKAERDRKVLLDVVEGTLVTF